MKEPNVLNVYSDTANMYGCEPCPECYSVYRWPSQDGKIYCDDCGLIVTRIDLSEIQDTNQKGVPEKRQNPQGTQ